MIDFASTQLSFDRELSSYSKVRWLVTKLLRNNRLFYRRVEPGAYLNLGCGPKVNARFANIDANWVPGVDICCDLRRGIPLPDKFSRGIFTEHCLEHLSLADAKALLAECHRVLMPGSIVRIIVPDLELYARAYVHTLDGRTVTFPNVHFVNGTGVNLPVAAINELFYGPSHRFIYDFATLSELLAAAGFSQVHRRAYRVGDDERLLEDDIAHVSESLYVEARRD